MTDTTGGKRVSFEAVDGGDRVVDELEGADLTIRTGATPELRPALTDLFPVPVDRAATVDAETLSVPEHAAAVLRTERGEVVEHLNEATEVSAGTYVVDISGRVKTYLRVSDTAVSTNGSFSDGPLRLEFDGPRTVTLGARSYHTRPEATITVPDDPEEVMTAVSYLGSAIAEFSPERSWPNLRGYPPRFRVGDELEVPDSLDEPEPDLTITVPETLADAYRVAPLAYYLGTEVVPGDEPTLRLANGYVEPLTDDGTSLEARVPKLLQRVFLLDTLARVEGYVPKETYEYRAIAPKLPFYPPNLYDASPAERLLEYLEVDWSVLEPHVPDWGPVATLRPAIEDAELLSHLTRALGPIHVAPKVEVPYAFASHDDTSAVNTATGLPDNAAALTPAAFENALDDEVPEAGSVVVTVITTTPERADRLQDALSTEDGHPFETVNTVVNPTETTIRAALQQDVDVLYFDLPATEGVVELDDGTVQVSEAEMNSRFVFLDDATFGTGNAFVESGAVVAAVTDRPAPVEDVGLYLRAVCAGLPVAVGGVESGTIETVEMRFVGDPTQQVAAASNGVNPVVLRVRSAATDGYRVGEDSYVTPQFETGGLYRFDGTESSRLYGNPVTRETPIQAEEILGLVDSPEVVGRFGDELLTSAKETSAEELQQLIEGEGTALQ